MSPARGELVFLLVGESARLTAGQTHEGRFAPARFAAQHGAVADAAARPQDRRDFESWNRSKCITNLGAAQLSAKPFGGNFKIVLSTPIPLTTHSAESRIVVTVQSC